MGSRVPTLGLVFQFLKELLMRYKSPLLCRGTHRLRGHTLKLNAKQRLVVWESEKDRKQKLLRHCTFLKRRLCLGSDPAPDLPDLVTSLEVCRVLMKNILLTG